MTHGVKCFRNASGEMWLADSDLRRLTSLGDLPGMGERRPLFPELAQEALLGRRVELHNPFERTLLCSLHDPGEVQLYWVKGWDVCSVSVSPVDLLTVRRLNALVVEFRLVTEHL